MRLPAKSREPAVHSLVVRSVGAARRAEVAAEDGAKRSAVSVVEEDCVLYASVEAAMEPSGEACSIPKEDDQRVS